MDFLQNNIPIESGRNAPLNLLRLHGSSNCDGSYSANEQRKERTTKRRYTRKEEVQQLAINKYKKNGRGITFNDLLSARLAIHKKQAQATLKRCLQYNILFAPEDHKPQQYYPAILKAEILKHRSTKRSKNYPIEVTGVRYSKAGFLQSKPTTSSSKDLDPVIVQTLEGYVLPLLPKSPLHIHKMQFKVRIPPECYHEIALPVDWWNKGKDHEEIIGRAHVRYCFYANGTVMVFTESSNAPFKLEDEVDLSLLIAFFGQIRDRLIVFLADKHERIVPNIMQWQLTQCDINKDIVVGDWLQVTGLKIQVSHLDHLFRIYTKSTGRNTVCRVEESCNSVNRPAIEAINNIFNPCDKDGRRLVEQDRKLVEILNRLKKIEALQRHNDDERSGSKTTQEKMEQEAIRNRSYFGCEDK